jgi:hypothetical protein
LPLTLLGRRNKPTAGNKLLVVILSTNVSFSLSAMARSPWNMRLSNVKLLFESLLQGDGVYEEAIGGLDDKFLDLLLKIEKETFLHMLKNAIILLGGS